MIEVKLGEILNAIEVMQKLANTEFSGKVAFKIGRLLREIENEFSTFNITRENILKKYGEKDENGELKINESGNFIIKKDKINDFNKEINELLETKIQINIEPLNPDELDGGNFTPQEILAIESFIK